MKNYITVRNNCEAVTIHCAISWDGIQQDFRNDVAPNGGYGEFELGDIGWHDLTIAIGAKENRFLKENNDKINIGRMLAQAAPLAAVVPGIGWVVAGIGTGVALILDKTGTASIYTLSVGADGPGTGTRTIKIQEGVQLDAYPVSITGLYTPHGNDVVVTGGDIRGHAQDDGTYLITGIDPLKASWSSRDPKNQQDYVASKP